MVDETLNISAKNSIIVCFSGKRKSGKDFVAKRLANLLAESSTVRVSTCAISSPLKDEFASLRGIDADRLKTDGIYKETVRAEMVTFGEQLRAKGPGYFCTKALQQRQPIVGENRVQPDRPEIILVSDCRRPSDLEFFQNIVPYCYVLLIRVDCSEAARQGRGYVFVPGIDDAETECALDNFKAWDFFLRNDENQNCRLDFELAKIVDHLNGKVSALNGL